MHLYKGLLQYHNKLAPYQSFYFYEKVMKVHVNILKLSRH
jgi:hypothetical protein